VPKFLSGQEQENALHISIKFYENTNRKNNLIELKKKIIELKRNMLYEKTVDDKMTEIELNSARTYRSTNLNDYVQSTYRSFIFDDQDNILTNRSGGLLLTNRTNKSVNFDDNVQVSSRYNQNNNELEENNKKLDYLTDKAVKTKYQNLINHLNSKGGIKNKMTGDTFSLSLPLTPRSLDLTARTNLSDESYISKSASKSLENLNQQLSQQFIQEYI
jgi:hypothetical protein